VARGRQGADVIMLDNYAPEDLKGVSARLKERWPHIIIEASGGITLETIAGFMAPSVDIISQGALTNGYDTLDFSLKVPKPESFAKRSRVTK
jgi:nicotinate-nucleotide pyrophosphorylase (carboxylating)